MENNYLILGAEEQLAREVALGVVVSRPPSAWLQLIPGMFIFDFLRRGSAIRHYTRRFMFARKLALQTAQAIVSGEEHDSQTSSIESQTIAWLKAAKLHSEEMVRLYISVIDVLVDHYQKLLNARGNSCDQLIEDAYGNRERFHTFVERITAAEQLLDRHVIEKIGPSESIRPKLMAEQEQLAKQRGKALERIFPV